MLKGFVTRREAAIYVGVLFAALIIVYGHSLWNGFVNWDDGLLIYENPIVQEFSFRSLYQAFTSYDPELYIPLTLLSYQLNHLVGGLNPFVYHLTNFILHGFNALFVAWIVLLLGKNKWIAAVTGLLFALHPLHTEAVVWASSRKDVLSAFFALISIGLYVLYHERQHKLPYFLGSLLAFTLALLSKVSVIFLPLALLLIDLRNRRKINACMFYEKIPFLALSILFGIIATFGKKGTGTLLMEKILIGAKAAVFYVQQMFVPYGLSVLYPYTKPVTFASLDLTLSFAALIVITLASILVWKRTREPLVAWGFYLLFTAPTFTNFAKGRDFMHDVYFASDRYAYIGSILIFFLVVLGLQKIRQRLPWRANIAVALLLVTLGILSFGQAAVWRDTEALFRNVLVYYPNSHVAHNNIAGILYRKGEKQKAILEYNASLAIRPNDAAYYNLGNIAAADGDFALAIGYYREALKQNKYDLDAKINVGSLLLRTGQLDEAKLVLEDARTISPNLVVVHFNLGVLYEQLGLKNEAMEAFEKVLQLDPGDGEAREHLKKLQG